MTVQEALDLLGLTPPLTHDQLDHKLRELLAVWHPHRYANLTNNPRKYMQLYTKAEAMSKEVRTAYALLSAWLSSEDGNPNR